jgi:hypothetical protein
MSKEAMEDILGNAAPGETSETDETAEAESTEESGKAGKDKTSAEETDETAVIDDDTKSKAELAALSKERERIRQKETALDKERSDLAAERERLAAGTAADGKGDGKAKDPKAELKELNKQYRDVLQELTLDPNDEAAQQRAEQLEDQMEEVRLAIVTESQRTVSAKDREANDFSTAYSDIHTQYPFLTPEHPQSDAELNEKINTFMSGRIALGDSRTTALQKAVKEFAPAYAKSIGFEPTATGKKQKEQTDEEKRLTEKLGKSGFSEVRSVGKTTSEKSFTGPTPMSAILAPAAKG